jgi:outer membrane beta-barrel protein
MKRVVFSLCTLVVANVGLGGGTAARAQAPAAEPPADKAAAPDDATAGLSNAVTNTNRPANPGEVAKRGWTDVVVVPRKAFLKGGRVELSPFAGVSLNDVLIRHFAFGGELNYYLSDVLSIGLQGQYFIKQRTDRESTVGLQYNRVAALNQYKFAGALDLGYTPGYGKFTLFNKFIVHWDLAVQAGVGVIQTEIIPRKVGDAAFKNNQIAANLGLGTHLYVSNWLTFNVALRDYLFNDTFEPSDRKVGENIDTVKSRGVSQFVQNVMLYAGLGLYLPTSFDYHTAR